MKENLKRKKKNGRDKSNPKTRKEDVENEEGSEEKIEKNSSKKNGSTPKRDKKKE